MAAPKETVVIDSEDEDDQVNGASYAKAVSTAASFVAASTNGGDSHGNGGSGGSNSHGNGNGTGGDNSDSDNASSAAPSRPKQRLPYNYWHSQDVVRLLKTATKLQEDYDKARVPASTLLEEFLKGGKPFRRGKLTSRNITSKMNYSRRIFVDMCTEDRERKFRQVRTESEKVFFECCKELWPEVVEQARGEVKRCRRSRATKKK